MLEGKTIVLGVSGGIAVYRALELTSMLKKRGAAVKVIMTKSAAEFVSPLSFRTLSQNPVALDMFAETDCWEVEHISLAKAADVFAVVPATANIIGKIANGIADDMLSTVAMATRAPMVIAPAMNTNMFENEAVQKNIETLRSRGAEIVMPASGRLACGDEGRGRLEEPELIASAISGASRKKDMAGMRVLVTAGATREAIDPVRYITNHSTGKMGYALAAAARHRGAEVTLISGVTNLTPPYGVKIVNAVSALDMYYASLKYAENADIIVSAAAVADFRPAEVAENKIKKGERMTLEIELTSNPDIISEIRQKFPGKLVAGFCMETENLIENARDKLEKKGLDLIAANSLREEGAGFGTDTNRVTIFQKENEPVLAGGSKYEVADVILNICAANLKKPRGAKKI